MRKLLPSKYKSKQSLITWCIILGAFFLIFLGNRIWPELGDFMCNSEQDMLFKARYLITGRRSTTSHLVLLPMDDGFIDAHNVSFFDRDIYAGFIDTLAANRASVIAFDMLFPEKLQGSHYSRKDEELIRASRKAGNVYFPLYLKKESGTGDAWKDKAFVCHPEIIKEGKVPEMKFIRSSNRDLILVSAGGGHINLVLDSDGKSRKFPLLYKYGEGFILSFPLVLICAYLDVKPGNIIFEASRFLTLKDASFYGGAIRKDIKIPVDGSGYLLINYPGPWLETFSSLLPSQLMTPGKEVFKQVNDSIVLVMDLTSGGKDFSSGIFDPVYPSGAILASVLNSILMEDYLYPGSVLEVMIFWTLLCLVLWKLSLELKPGIFLSLILLFFLFILGWNIFRFIQSGKILMTALPFGGFFLASMGVTIYKLFLKDRETALGIIKKLETRVQKQLPVPEPPPIKAAYQKDDNRERLIRDRLSDYGITDRQGEIIRLTFEGYESGEVGYRLGITRRTVDNHLRKIYDKTGAHNKLSLISKIYG